MIMNRMHEDKIVVVTGGGHGIGRCTAERLAAEGAKVAVADINTEWGEEVVSAIQSAGGTARFVHTDLAIHEQIRHMIESTIAEWGTLDYLVNNAYVMQRGSVTQLTEEEWDRAMGVNLKSYFLACKYAFPAMEKNGSGSIVNLASVHSYGAWPNGLVYDTAKAAIVNMTRQLAVDGGPLGIRVNAVAPGWIITHTGWDITKGLEYAKRTYPVGRPGQPEEVANAINFLLSEEASFVSGHTLAVDGGLMAQLQDSPRIAGPEFSWT